MIPHPNHLITLEEVLETWSAAGNSSTPQVFHVSNDMRKAAMLLAKDVVGGGGWRFPAGSRPPASPTVLHVTYDHFAMPYVLTSAPNGPISILMQRRGRMDIVAKYRPGSNHITRSFTDDEEGNMLGILACTLATICFLINTPRHVETVPAPRAQRRRLERAFSVTLRTVRWRIGADRVQRAGGARDAEAGVPLHYRRGHYRRAEPWYERAEMLTRPGDSAARHYQWIEGMWVGSPEFGVVSHDYTPQLTEAFGAGAGQALARP